MCQYKRAYERYLPNAQCILLGTQADVRDWFSVKNNVHFSIKFLLICKQKRGENKEIVAFSGVDLFSLIPDGKNLFCSV